MNIVILGAGKTGSYIASILSEEKHNVIVVDKDLQAIEKIGRELDISTLHAAIPSRKLFERLEENPPDLLIAATGSDETNLIACTIGKNSGAMKTIALVHGSDYLERPSQIDFGRLFYVDHFLRAELLAAQDLFKVLVHTGDIAVEQFAHGTIQMRTLAVPERWDKGGVALKDLPLPDEFIIGLIRRRIPEQILFPHGNDHLLPGDEATVLGEAKAMNHLHELFRIPEHAVKSVLIVGGSPVAAHLAQFLCQQRIDVRIIERDHARCEELADLLPKATIINRDGCDSRLLRRERVEEADALVSCTKDDETNLLAASIAKQAGCQKAIALTTDSSLIPILEHLGIMPALSARLNITNRILSIINEKEILSVASVCNDQAKIVELKIPQSSKAVGIPLSDLSARLPKDLLIAAIENQGRVMIGRGNRIICPNDTVIVICAPRHLAHLQEIFF